MNIKRITCHKNVVGSSLQQRSKLRMQPTAGCFLFCVNYSDDKAFVNLFQKENRGNMFIIDSAQ